PSALGQNGAASYDPMLAPAQAGEEPNHAVVVNLSGPQTMDSILGDLQAGMTVSSGGSNGNIPQTAANGDDGAGTGISNVPRDRIVNPSIPGSAATGDPNDRGTPIPNPYYSGPSRGGNGGGGSASGGETPPSVVSEESTTYWLQQTQSF
ncbi:MAG: hypothetical protein II738_01165, partial [Clostridia bacterium]|nr:hypothetical protein [Clostridia bacterium]